MRTLGAAPGQGAVFGAWPTRPPERGRAMKALQFQPLQSLAGKRALITAGASGLGLQMAQAFMAAGARVMVCDADANTLIELAADCPGLATAVADVSDEAEVARLFKSVDQCLGGLDVLVNTAGAAGPACGVGAITLAEWNRALVLKLTSQFLCVREALPRLRKSRQLLQSRRVHGGPCILNLSTATGLHGAPGWAAHTAFKWAVVGFTKTLAVELGPDGIRVNAILPASLPGGRSVNGASPLTSSPLRQQVNSEDVARTAVFAASDRAAGITGQSLLVGGVGLVLS